MTRPPIKDRALLLLRRARDQHGYNSEALTCDYATEALVLEGVDPRIARSHVQRVWRERFAVAGAI